MKRDRYAFWDHDLYPYVLSAQIVGTKSRDGYYPVKGYGRSIQPLQIISGNKGRDVSEKLKELSGELRYEKAQLDREFTRRALRVAPFLKKCKRTSAYENHLITEENNVR